MADRVEVDVWHVTLHGPVAMTDGEVEAARITIEHRLTEAIAQLCRGDQGLDVTLEQ